MNVENREERKKEKEYIPKKEIKKNKWILNRY